jgi:MFS family permease
MIGARLLQGIGAAAQASVILAIIVTEFPAAAERARAMGAYVFVSVAGGSLGLLAGGLLTEALSWHWVFFVNLPIGVATFAAAYLVIRSDGGPGLGSAVGGLGGLAARHHVADERHLRDRRGDRPRLHVAQVLGMGGRRGRAGWRRSSPSSRASPTRSCRSGSCACAGSSTRASSGASS